MDDVERNRHGLSFAEWDEKARGLNASDEFFSWDIRESYWWKGMSPRWTIEHFKNVSIVRRIMMEKTPDFRLGNPRATGKKAPYREK